MSFERHGEVKFGIHEAAHEEIGIAFESQDFKLDGVHEPVKQGSPGEFLVEDHDIEKVKECM